MKDFKTSSLWIILFIGKLIVLQSTALPTAVDSQHEKTIDTAFLKSVVLVNEKLNSYKFSCEIQNGQLVGLSADRKSLLFYNVKQASPPTVVDLPIPGDLFEISSDGKIVAIAHDSYISIVNVKEGHSLKTYPITVVKASSLFIITKFACLIPAFDQWTNIQCLDVHSGDTCTCGYQVYAGALGYVNTAKNWMYMLDQGLSPQSMHKFNVSKEPDDEKLCLNYIYDNPDFGAYYYGERLWFSYDGSRMFLDNGLSLYSSDDKLDMKPHGDFNSSHEKYQYNSFSQSSKDPYKIAGIRSDVNGTIFYYSWPYLQPIKEKERVIPVPMPGARINRAIEVEICDKTDTTYAVVNYTLPNGNMKIGVVAFT